MHARKPTRKSTVKISKSLQSFSLLHVELHKHKVIHKNHLKAIFTSGILFVSSVNIIYKGIPRNLYPPEFTDFFLERTHIISIKIER